MRIHITSSTLPSVRADSPRALSYQLPRDSLRALIVRSLVGIIMPYACERPDLVFLLSPAYGCGRLAFVKVTILVFLRGCQHINGGIDKPRKSPV